MTSATLLASLPTGDTAIAVLTPERHAFHTAVLLDRVDDLTLGATLRAWDFDFARAQRWYHSPLQVLEGVATVTTSGTPYGLLADDEDTLAEAQPQAEAVAVVEQIADILGLPVADILEAAGIKKRTYFHWKTNPSTRPRLDSLGELWGLAQSVDILSERLGTDAPRWMKERRSRRRSFRAGAHLELVRELIARDIVDHADPDMAYREMAMSAGFFDSPATVEDAANLSDRLTPVPTRVVRRTPVRRPDPK